MRKNSQIDLLTSKFNQSQKSLHKQDFMSDNSLFDI